MGILRVLGGLEPQNNTHYLEIEQLCGVGVFPERGDLVPLDIQSIPGVSFKMES